MTAAAFECALSAIRYTHCCVWVQLTFEKLTNGHWQEWYALAVATRLTLPMAR
jgi:hypothetical protein